VPVSGPVQGGSGSGAFASAKVLRGNRPQLSPDVVFPKGIEPPRAANDDLPANCGRIVPHANVVVGYIGRGWHQIAKNAGAGGSFDADAVSTATLDATGGKLEVILEYATGTFVAGMNANDPTATSGYTGGVPIIGVYMDGSLTALMSFGSQIGAAHSQTGNYAKLTYDPTTDTFDYRLSSDGVTWGAVLESVVPALGTTNYYFDSSLSPASTRFNTIFQKTVAQTYNVSLQGQTTPVPSLAKSTSKPLLTATTPSPALTRQTAKPLRTTSTPAPSLLKAVGKALKTTSTPVPTLSRSIGKIVQGQSTPAPSLKRSIGKLLLTATTPAPSLMRAIAKALLTATTPEPSLVRTTSKTLRTQTTPEPSLFKARQYHVTLQAIAGASGAVSVGPKVTVFFRR